MTRPLNLDDYEAAAKQRLPAAVYDNYAGAADDEITLHANRTTYREQYRRPVC